MSLLSSGIELEYLQECPICGAPQEEWYSELGQAVSWGLWIVYRRCDVCHMAFQCPRPSSESSLEAYASNAYREVTTSEGNSTTIYEARLQQIRAHRIVEIMKMNDIKPTRYLDIGSSLGVLCYKVADEFECESWGMEPSDVYQEMARGFEEEIETKMGFVGDLDDLEGKFDVISCIHVLEHVNEPIEYLKKMKKLLTEGGKLVLEVPNGHRTTGMSIWHPYIFITETLGMVLEKAGFDNHDIRQLLSYFPGEVERRMPSDIAIITNSPREEEPAPE